MSDTQILHLFGGKGGVGKTTLSTAFALNLSEKFPKDKVLLVTSEPSRALSDLIKKKLSPKPSKLVAGKGEGGLYAAEFEAAPVMVPFLDVLKPAITEALTKGALLSPDEVSKLLGHLP